jgi:hypothetical protein
MSSLAQLAQFQKEMAYLKLISKTMTQKNGTKRTTISLKQNSFIKTVVTMNRCWRWRWCYMYNIKVAVVVLVGWLIVSVSSLKVGVSLLAA